MSIEQFLPPTTLVVLSVAFSIARFENQRWARYRNSGRRGSSEAAGLFVDLTGLVAWVFAIAFLAAVWWDYGLLPTISLFAIGVVAGVLWSLISRDSLFLWMLATAAVWALMIALACQVSWFGLF